MILAADKNKYKEKEEMYLAVRNKEQRVISDEILTQLPEPPISYIHYDEWQIRAKNVHRFLKHIKNNQLDILDLGCGNGWMTNLLGKKGHTVTGMDLNIAELQQAERVFGSNHRIKWMYADIMDTPPKHKYDLIVLAASCQYFPDIHLLTQKLISSLKPGSSVHLLDSFFYKPNELPDAKKRTKRYYAEMGIPEMSNYYFHHNIEDLKALGYKRLYPYFEWIKKPAWWVLQH